VILMRVEFMVKMINKNVLALILIAIVLIISASTPVSGAEGFKLSAVAESEGTVGENATVKVLADHAAGIEGGQFILNFDPILVRPLIIEAGELIASAEGKLQMANIDYSPGQLVYMWVTPYADTADSGVICTIKFELLKEGNVLLELSDVVVAPEGTTAEKAVPGRLVIRGLGVDQDDNENNNLDRDDEPTINEGIGNEDTGAGSNKGINDSENPNNEGALTETDTSVNNTGFPLVAAGVALLAVLSAAGYYIIKKRKIGRH
jgi:hypothetical protein